MERVIVAGVDRSARSRIAADWAAHEALLRGLPLRVVHVTPLAGLDAPQLWPYRPEVVAARVVAELAARHPTLDIDDVRLAGTAASALCSQSRDAEMVVLGLRGEGGFAGLSLGSTALAVAGASDCPVVLVPTGLAREGPVRRPDKVTLAVDARDPADGAIDFALDTARLRLVRLHALHAGAPPTAQPGRVSRAPSAPEFAARLDHEVALLSDVLRPWHEKYPYVQVLEDVVLFDPATALIRTSGNAELMVLGRGLGSGLGPVAYDVARHTRCPLAVVPA
ncbi:universal stress protein [Streptomyces sp. NBC_00878]|uniref:universal stress protein n=1 Tax=Streptomyces sp. NBC_00878 TaxID=2975854 RepID=UPI00225B74D5|nr:universal stress protein [Streptomyces sp. NBC_00878]MCX4904018.1 universal stress protein [Streptomyces sp. NBC_00878]